MLTSLTSSGHSASKPTPNKRRKKKTKKETCHETKITDYFPAVRRSDRKSEKAIKQEKSLDLEKAILACNEDHLKVCYLEGKGRGVKSSKPFRRGDFVVEYKGDLVHRETASKRELLYEQDEDVGCYMYYFEYNSKQYCIDATAETEYMGRLVNHSSKYPNCKTQVVCIDGVPHLILVALRDISVDDELLYDYGDRRKESIEAHPWLLTS